MSVNQVLVFTRHTFVEKRESMDGSGKKVDMIIGMRKKCFTVLKF
jgi:hypothetical protein